MTPKSIEEDSDTKADSAMARFALSGVVYPGQNDVMLGRGGESNYHSGNLNFRRIAEAFRPRYRMASKVVKPMIAAEVVAAWRNLNPPGRFLTRTDCSRNDSLWHDVGEAHAIKRATKTLGERSQRERRAEGAAKLKMFGEDKKRSSSLPSSPTTLTLSFLAERDSDMSDASEHGTSSFESKKSTSSLPEMAAAIMSDMSQRKIGASFVKPWSWPELQEGKLENSRYQELNMESTCNAVFSNAKFGVQGAASSGNGGGLFAAWTSDSTKIWSIAPNEEDNELASLNSIFGASAGVVAESVPTAAYLAQFAFDD